MRNIIYITTLFISFISYSQNESEIKYQLNAVKYIQQKWEYFELQNEIEVRIIKHIPTKIVCGYVTSASMTIVETENGEIIRIIDLCNLSNDYKINQILKVRPTSKPLSKVS